MELGRISKPEAQSFSNKRKLYCVANIYSVEDAPDDYKALVDRYWDEVILQVQKIESAGKVKKIFCELITGESEESLEILSKINEKIPLIIRKKVEEGGVLVQIEDRSILGPYTDWGNCLRVVYTGEVFTKILEFYKEYSEKRLNHIMDIIDKNLLEAEAGLLIMKDDDRAKIQFPKDIEVFLITPPSYDDIMRWFREKLTRPSE